MKNLNITKKKDFFLLIGMLLVAISLPLATKLAQQNQENRSQAANCTGTGTKCSIGSVYKCNGGIWVRTGASCATATTAPTRTPTKKPTTAPTKSPTRTPTSTQNCTNGAIKCIGSGQLQQCILGNWTNASKCASGKCNSSGSGCGGTVPTAVPTRKPTSGPTPVCNSSHCGNCSQSNCVSAECSWGYNGSSSMYCYPKSAAVPTSKPTAIPTANCSSSKCGDCANVTTCNNQSGCNWSYSGNFCETKLTGVCGTAKNTCSSGKLSDIADTNGSYLWMCGNKTCAITKPSCTTKCGDCSTLTECNNSPMKCNWSYNGNYCESIPTGVCGTAKNTCSSGTLSDIADTTGLYMWMCGNKTCSSAISIFQDPACVAKGGVCKLKTVCEAEGKKWKAGYCTTGNSAADNVACCKDSWSGGGGGSDDDGGGDTYPTTPPQQCVSTLTVTPTTLTLKVGESSAVTATDSCTGTSTGITWTSDNANIATVNASGLVTAMAVGSTATITAKNTGGKTATVSVIVIASGTKSLTFNFAFSGIKPAYINLNGASYNCLGSLGALSVEVTNKPKNISEVFSDVQFSVLGNDTNANGDQIFQVRNLTVGSSLNLVDTYNYLKVKGPFHLKRRFCSDGQTGKLDETTVCDINLFRTDGTAYDFSGYELLAGDVDLNGIVNGVDFVTIKNSVNTGAEPVCGTPNDLNMDGIVNGVDLSLIRDISLAQVDDQ
jgi:hypothetical protein